MDEISDDKGASCEEEEAKCYETEFQFLHTAVLFLCKKSDK